MHRPLIPFVCLLVACTSEGDPTPDFVAHPVTITPTAAWAGATVTLRSEAFKVASLEELGLTIDDVSLAPVVVNDTTLQITIPSATTAGAHYLHSAVTGAPETLGGMYVYGWAGTTSGTTPIWTDAVPWPVDVPTGVLVGSGFNGTVPTFIPTTPGGSVISYGGLELNQPYSPSTSFVPGVVIDRTGRVAQLHALDSGWVLLDSMITNNRNLYQLSDSQWLKTGSHLSFTFAESDTGLLRGADLTTESPWLLVRSLATGRATFVLSAATPELQILNSADGTVAATVPGIIGTQAAVFSPSGASLYLTGGPTWNGPFSILRVDPTNGAILAKDSIHVGMHALAVHPALPGLLFELAKAADSTWLLRIRNGNDLSIVAELGSNTYADECRRAYSALTIDGGTVARAFINRCGEGYRVVHWELMPGA